MRGRKYGEGLEKEPAPPGEPKVDMMLIRRLDLSRWFDGGDEEEGWR